MEQKHFGIVPMNPEVLLGNFNVFCKHITFITKRVEVIFIFSPIFMLNRRCVGFQFRSAKMKF